MLSESSVLNERVLSEPDNLTQGLLDRYGSLALSRAAGQAFAAEKCGDHQKVALWHSIVRSLRLRTLVDVTKV